MTSEPFLKITGISIRLGFYLQNGPGFTKCNVGDDFGLIPLGHGVDTSCDQEQAIRHPSSRVLR